MVQVSMDGPNVNLQFLKDLKTYLKTLENEAVLLEIEIFPLKFGATRWLENGDVAGRALDMLCSLRKFVTTAKENETGPTSAGYKLFKEFITDPLLKPKLDFFKTLTSDVEPFVR